MVQTLHARQPGRHQAGLGAHRQRPLLRALLAAAHRAADREQRGVPVQRQRQRQSFPLQQAVLDYTRTFSPRLVNDFRIGMNYFPAEPTPRRSPPSRRQPDPRPADASICRACTSPVPSSAASRTDRSPSAPPTRPEIFHQTVDPVFRHRDLDQERAHAAFGFQFIRYRNNYIPATSNDGAAGQIGFNGTYTDTPKPTSSSACRPIWATGWDSPAPWASATTRSAHSCRTTGASAAADGQFRNALAGLHADLRSARPHDELRHVQRPDPAGGTERQQPRAVQPVQRDRQFPAAARPRLQRRR